MAWVRARHCKLQKRMRSTRSRKWYSFPVACPCGRWFLPGTPVSSTTNTGRHDIAKMLLKVALKHQKFTKIKSVISMHCIGYATCVYTINCALSNKPSFGIGVYFFDIWSNFLNLRHLVWDCVWLYELSPYSIRFSVHPALCESACKFQPIWPLNLWP